MFDRERMEIERCNQKEEEYWNKKKIHCTECGALDFLDNDGICPICKEVRDLDEQIAKEIEENERVWDEKEGNND
jgi:rubrerythrin